MRVIPRLLTIMTALALALPATAAHAFPVTALQQTGPVTRRFNIAVLGDGYRTDEQAKLTSDAKMLIDDVFEQAPYANYRALFNVKVVQSVSVDSGAKRGTVGGNPNTLFGAGYLCAGLQRLICGDNRAVLLAAAKDVPEFNLALVVVNDAMYGGSGGDVPYVSANRQASEIIRHELGHTLADLADEYEAPSPNYPACSPANDCPEPNATLRNTRTTIKWLQWIPATTPVPTPEGAGFVGAGVFEGARYFSSGIYRPVESICKMRALGQPFCPVCSEGLVRAFWNLPNTGLIDDAAPSGDVKADTCAPVTFSVVTPTITPSTLTFSWTVDGKPQVATSTSLAVIPGSLSAGPHQVLVTVTDSTPLVRSDPQGLLRQKQSWNLTTVECAADASPPIDSAAGDTAEAGEDAPAADTGPSDRTADSTATDAGATDRRVEAATDTIPGIDRLASETAAPPTDPAAQGCACELIARAHERRACDSLISLLVVACVFIRRRPGRLSRRTRGA